MGKFGDFQADVGRVSAKVNVFGAWVFFAFACLIAIGLTVYALIPVKVCTPKPGTQEEECKKEQKNKPFLWSLLLIPFGGLVVGGSYFWLKIVKKNKTAAQIGGTMAELQLAKSLLSPR